jgi:hypothetical protein
MFAILHAPARHGEWQPVRGSLAPFRLLVRQRLKSRLFLRLAFDGNALVSRGLDHAQPDDHTQIK